MVNAWSLAASILDGTFDEETKQSFLELYDKVDADVDITKEEVL